MRFHVALKDVFDILHAAHAETGHGGRTRMYEQVKRRYVSITSEHVVLYINLCVTCQEKAKVPRKGLVHKLMIFEKYLLRAQVDLIDMQANPDGEYRFILNYQNILPNSQEEC